MSWTKVVRQVWQTSSHLTLKEKAQLRVLKMRAPKIKNMLWVLSSGTQSVGSLKAIGILADAFLAAAGLANQHLKVTREDRWLLAIPEYHVGGLAILARAHLSQSAVFYFKENWSAEKFCNCLSNDLITLTSLVPTQVFDLVAGGLRPPQSLRAIVVGGGALDVDLYSRARALGWPLLPSYGLSETSAQVATASLSSLRGNEFPPLTLLPGVQVELREQRVFVATPGACSFVAVINEDGVFTLEAPQRAGYLPTEDLASWVGGGLRIHGRSDSVVKVLGVLVPILDVEAELSLQFRARNWQESFAVVPVPHLRDGHQLVLFTDSKMSLRDWRKMVDDYNMTAIGPRRLQSIAYIPRIPRTDLGKVRRRLLSVLLSGGGE